MGTEEYLHLSSQLYEINPDFNLSEKALYIVTWLRKERPVLYKSLIHDFESIESEIYARRECDTANSLAANF